MGSGLHGINIHLEPNLLRKINKSHIHRRHVMEAEAVGDQQGMAARGVVARVGVQGVAEVSPAGYEVILGGTTTTRTVAKTALDD